MDKVCVSVVDEIFDTCSLVWDEVGEIRPTALTAASLKVVDSATNKGAPRFIFGCVDYEREALAFAFGKAVSQLRGIDVPICANLDEISSETLLTFDDFCFICLGSDEKYVACKPTIRENKNNRGMISKWLRESVPPAFACLDDAAPSRYINISAAVKTHKLLPESIRFLHERYASYGSAVYLATSCSLLRNVPPTHLRKGTVSHGGDSYPLDQCLPISYDCFGEISNNYGTMAACKPAIVVSARDNGIADFGGLIDLIDAGEPIGCVVIQMPNAEMLQTCQYELNRLADAKMPIVIFCPPGTFANKIESALADKGFSLIDWEDGYSLIEEDDSKLSTSQRRHHRSPSATWLVIDDDRGISEVASALFALRAKKGQMSDKSSSAFIGLNKLLLQILRMTEMLTPQRSSALRKECETYINRLASDPVLSADESRSLARAGEVMRTLLAPDVALPKENEAYRRIVSSICGSRNVQLIVDKASSLEANNYWTAVLREKGFNTSFFEAVTLREFLRQGNPPDSLDVVISGWFYSEEMELLFRSGIADRTYLLLYKGNDCKLETSWALATDDRMKQSRRLSACKSVESIKQAGGEPPSKMVEKAASAKSQFEEDRRRQDERPSVLSDDSVSSFVRDMQLERAKDAVRGDEPADTLARPVFFTDGKVRWLRADAKDDMRGDRLVMIEQCGDEVNLTRKPASAIVAGEINVKFSSDDFALVEAAKGLAADYETIMSIAQSWRKPIDFLIDQGCGANYIARRISDAGCTKSFLTIRNWIVRRDTIAPQDREDIVRIFSSLGAAVIDEEIDRIMLAASIVRGRHITAGRESSSNLLDTLCDDARRFGLDNAARNFKDRHPDLGEAELLVVDFVGEPSMISSNKLHYYYG